MSNTAEVLHFPTVKEVIETMDDEALQRAASHPFVLDDGSFHASFHRNLYNEAIDELERRRTV